LSQESSQADRLAYGKLFQEVQKLAKETELEIVAIQGEKSEKLMEIFGLYSFFAF